MVTAFASLLGLLLGSFATVIIDRIPTGEPWVRERSRCESCGAQIRWYDNVPLVSWLVLRGHCRECRATISWRYPAVEAVTAVGFGIVASTVDELWVGAALMAMVWLTIVLTAIDLEHLRLPDAVLAPGYVVLVALLVSDAVAVGDFWPLARAGIGALIALVVYGGLWIVYPAGLGFGDVKLAPLTAIVTGYLGWEQLGLGLFSGPFVGIVLALVTMRPGKSLVKRRIPYGPAILAGMWIGVVAGPEIVGLYLEAVVADI